MSAQNPGKVVSRQIITLGILLGTSLQLNAAAYQIFPTLAYDNPASLGSVKQYTTIIGITDPLVRMQYTGVAGPVTGTTVSNTSVLLPYARAAARISPSWVAGFDITHPVLSNIRYPADSFINSIVVDSILQDTNYSPKISYKVSDRLTLGVGFDANNMTDAQVNFDVPPMGLMVNQSSSWGYGWDVGAAITLNDSNFLNFSYYSEINLPRMTGYSQWGSVYQSSFSDNVVLPATWTLNLVHLLTPKWTVLETVRYVQWSKERDLTLMNTAIGTLFFPLNYNDNWSGMVAARYQWNDKWGISAAVEYATNPQPTAFRPIALPACAVTIVGGGIEYALTSRWTAQFRYGYAFANPEINQQLPVPQLGHVDIGVNILDLGVTWKV